MFSFSPRVILSFTLTESYFFFGGGFAQFLAFLAASCMVVLAFSFSGVRNFTSGCCYSSAGASAMTLLLRSLANKTNVTTDVKLMINWG